MIGDGSIVSDELKDVVIGVSRSANRDTSGHILVRMIVGIRHHEVEIVYIWNLLRMGCVNADPSETGVDLNESRIDVPDT